MTTLSGAAGLQTSACPIFASIAGRLQRLIIKYNRAQRKSLITIFLAYPDSLEPDQGCIKIMQCGVEHTNFDGVNYFVRFHATQKGL
jgi:hypothetical protein